MLMVYAGGAWPCCEEEEKDGKRREWDWWAGCSWVGGGSKVMFKAIIVAICECSMIPLFVFGFYSIDTGRRLARGGKGWMDDRVWKVE